MSEHYDRWNKIKNINDISHFITENQSKFDKILTIMYDENKKHPSFGFIDYTKDGVIKLSVKKYIKGSYTDEALERLDFTKQCPLFFNKIFSIKPAYLVIRYPHQITLDDLSDTLDCFYDENGSFIPTSDIIKNKPSIILENLYFGEAREKLLKCSQISNITEGIILINCPSEYTSYKNIHLKFMPYSLSIEFANESGFKEHIDMWPICNFNTDVFIMFCISTSKNNSYYLPVILKNLKFLKDIKFRKKLFDRMFFKENTPNMILDNVIEKLGSFKYKSKYYHPSLWNDKKISTKIIENLELKIKKYKQTDKEKFFEEPSLTIDDCIKLLLSYNFMCDECGREVMLDHNKGCYLQYSFDRIDDNKPHIYDNLRLCCLSCNINHRKNMFISYNSILPPSIIYFTECKSCPDHKQKKIFD